MSTQPQYPARAGATVAASLRLALAQHLPGPVEPEPWPGHTETAQDRTEREAAQQAGREAVWQHYLQTLDVDPAADLALLRPYVSAEETGQWAEQMRGWLGGGAKNLVLQGKSGRGKTYAMVAIGNRVIEQGKTAVVVPLPIFAKATRPGGDERLVELMYSADLVGIDDMGAESTTDWVVQELRSLLNTRNGNLDQRTMISTNLSSAAIIGTDGKPGYGTAVLDRMLDRAVVKVFAGKGSMRSRVLDF